MTANKKKCTEQRAFEIAPPFSFSQICLIPRLYKTYNEAITDRFPREGVHVLLDLDGVDGDLLFAHVEDLEVVVEAGVLHLLLLATHLAVSVNLHKSNR
jgi:hypothetical protein